MYLHMKHQLTYHLVLGCSQGGSEGEQLVQLVRWNTRDLHKQGRSPLLTHLLLRHYKCTGRDVFCRNI